MVEEQPEVRRVRLVVVATPFIFGGVFAACLLTPRLVVHFLQLSLSLRGETGVALAGTLLAELISLRLLTAWLWKTKRSVTSLGWRARGTVVAYIAAVVLALLYATGTLATPAVLSHMAEGSALKLWGVICTLVAAGVEETIFRGFVMSELQAIGAPAGMQILLSGLNYAVARYWVTLAYGPLNLLFPLPTLLVTTIFGMFLGGVYLLGRRSLLPPVLAHGLINLLVEPWVIMASISW